MVIMEIIATSIEEAILAERYGADRIELIHAFTDGGLSPSLELSKEVCSAVSIPVNVMVRPHAKSFVYSIDDFHQIEAEIDYLANNTKANAVVFGSLTEDGLINHEDLTRVIKRINGQLGLTFHRAIDASNNILVAFEELQNYGSSINNILSSGGQNTAQEGLAVLTRMQDISHAYDNGASLLPGSGVNSLNATEIINTLQVNQLHVGSGVRIKNVLSQPLFDSLRSSMSRSK